MKLKKTSVVGIIILATLLIAIVLIVYNFIGSGAKDIKAARGFMNKLYSINAISTEQDFNSIKYRRSKISNKNDQLVHRTIVTQTYGIDLDKNNNVIGFAKKENPANIDKIGLEKAKALSAEYLKNICDSDVMFKTVQPDDESSKLPYYIFIYTKEKDGYPFYFDEIKVNINKETGFLDGYSNSTMQREAKDPAIDYSKQEAEEVAVDGFNKYNKDGVVIDRTDLAYSENKSEDNPSTISEVCYVVTVQGKDSKDNDIKWKLFVSAENGNIINIVKDGVENQVTTS